jgi:amidase
MISDLIKRREFLRRAAVGGAAVLAGTPALGGALAQCAEGDGRPAAVDGTYPDVEVPAFELDEVTILDLQSAMGTGARTARSIAQAYLDRIAAIDSGGPCINAVIETNPDALETADALDAERRAGRVRGLLHGIPVLLKDNIDTADRMETTAGSRALLGQKPQEDAFLVKRLRDAGVVILGKTNLSEWANFRSMRSSSGWSGRGGQTRNPYVLDRNPCGSSSGSGAAIAANLAAVAVGTETDGSIVCPSHANSLVGLKPTVGLVSRSGVVPISHTQDTAGPMARTVADAAALLGAIAAPDPADPASRIGKGPSPVEYTEALDPGGLRGARIGVARNLFVAHERVTALMEEAIGAMQGEGATVVDPADIKTAQSLDEPEFEVLLYDFKADLNAYLAARGTDWPAGSLEDLITYNEENRDTEMPFFGQEIFLMAQAKGPLTDLEYLRAQRKARLLSRNKGIDKVMKEHRLDAIVAPTGGPPWPTDLVNGDHFLGASSSPAAVAGYPNITVPLGYVFGLPVGISFFAGAFSEPVLIRIAYAFEQTTRARRPPRFLVACEV